MLGSFPAAGPLASPGLHLLRVGHLGRDGCRPATGPFRPGRPARPRPITGRVRGSRPGRYWTWRGLAPVLAAAADLAAGPNRAYTGVSDDELIGVLTAWQRTDAWAAAGWLSAAAELIRALSGHRACPCGACRGPATVGQVLRG